MYDFLVYIGRFQPFHNGHKSVIDSALTMSKRIVLLIGSYNSPRTLRNPWTGKEREELIVAHYNNRGITSKRIDLQPLIDRPGNDLVWKDEVKSCVLNATWNYRTALGLKIGLIGHMKHDTDYLTWFPEWPLVDIQPTVKIDATTIRDRYFGIDTTVMPEETAEMLFRQKMGMK